MCNTRNLNKDWGFNRAMSSARYAQSHSASGPDSKKPTQKVHTRRSICGTHLEPNWALQHIGCSVEEQEPSSYSTKSYYTQKRFTVRWKHCSASVTAAKCMLTSIHGCRGGKKRESGFERRYTVKMRTRIVQTQTEW